LTAGGIGVGETAFDALFKLTGINGEAEALLCVRLWNISVGLLGLLVYLYGVRRIVYPYDEEISGCRCGMNPIGIDRLIDASLSIVQLDVNLGLWSSEAGNSIPRRVELSIEQGRFSTN
jgi:hypothetical protein